MVCFYVSSASLYARATCVSEAMGDKGRQSKDPFELDQLRAEMESLQAQLS